MGIPSGLIRSGLAVLATTIAASMMAPSTSACDTPVYRYAMYRWLPAPYEVYYFHNGELGDAGQKMKEAIDAAGESQDSPTNIVFLPVDLAKDNELTGVPPDVKEAWQKQEDPTVPRYLVSSPVGSHLLLGSLTPEELPAMFDSPLRQQTGKSLESGSAGVYIFLQGEDAEANTAAEKVLREVVTDVGAGKVALYSLPPAAGAFGGEEDEEEASDQYKLAVGLLSVARDDPKEKWLVDCLLALEPDLRESKEPIVFMVYGRGRVLFSCLGKGIHRDNLIQDIEFVTGACSCTVKEQNPGVDLLMCYNWDAAAESISEQYGTEEGSRYEFGGDALFPELIIPPEDEMPKDEGSSEEGTGPNEDAPKDEAIAQVDTSTTPGVAPDVTPTASTAEGANAEPATAESEVGTEAATEQDVPAEQQVATLTPENAGGLPVPGPEDSDSSFRSIFWVGAALVGAFLVLLGATFVVLRPR